MNGKFFLCGVFAKIFNNFEHMFDVQKYLLPILAAECDEVSGAASVVEAGQANIYSGVRIALGVSIKYIT